MSQEARAGPLRHDQLPEEGEEVREDCNAALVEREREASLARPRQRPPCWLGELVGSWPCTPSYPTRSGAKVPLPPLKMSVFFTMAFPVLQVKKCALTCGGNGAAAGTALDTCGCTVYRNGASAGSLHLGVCQKRETVNGDRQTVCTPGPCAGDSTPCRTMSPAPPPPPDMRPCAAHTKNTAVYHKMMDLWGGGGGNGCDDVTTGYDAALPALKQCKAADGGDNRISVDDYFNWPVKDLCPEVCGGRQMWADCVFSNSRSDDNDIFIVAWTGATCAELAAAPGPSPGGYCDEPIYNWFCGASCRGGVAYSYDECALPFGQEKYEGECPHWVKQGYYAQLAECLADSPNWVSDTFGSCPSDPTGVDCIYTRSALGAGSCP